MQGHKGRAALLPNVLLTRTAIKRMRVEIAFFVRCFASQSSGWGLSICLRLATNRRITKYVTNHNKTRESRNGRCLRDMSGSAQGGEGLVHVWQVLQTDTLVLPGNSVTTALLVAVKVSSQGQCWGCIFSSHFVANSDSVEV